MVACYLTGWCFQADLLLQVVDERKYFLSALELGLLLCVQPLFWPLPPATKAERRPALVAVDSDLEEAAA